MSFFSSSSYSVLPVHEAHPDWEERNVQGGSKRQCPSVPGQAVILGLCRLSPWREPQGRRETSQILGWIVQEPEQGSSGHLVGFLDPKPGSPWLVGCSQQKPQHPAGFSLSPPCPCRAQSSVSPTSKDLSSPSTSPSLLARLSTVIPHFVD